MEEREIPTFCFDFEINEENDDYYFYCPVTGKNVVDMDEWPKELVMYFDNLEGVRYLNQWATTISEQLEDKYPYDVKDYVINNLSSDKPYYCLIITHPEGVHGDFIELYYEGIYPG